MGEQVKITNEITHLVSKHDVLQQRGFLTIGIPTVHRKGLSYLSSTLHSLLNNTLEENKSKLQIRIVILLADLNPTYNVFTAQQIRIEFMDFIERGIIHLLYLPENYYPDFAHLKITFDDSPERVKWRSKQNLDYSFLMSYATNISQYYMQLEDDVIAAFDYVSKIRDFITEHEPVHWVMLDVTNVGFIGKLFRSEDIAKLAVVLRTFFNEQPCDYLLVYFLHLMLQTNRYLREPRLFKHLGIRSSLESNVRNEDKSFFDGEIQVIRGDNPSAELFTSLKPFLSYSIEKLYNPKFGNMVFWAKSPLVGDTLVVAFNERQYLKRVLVTTGFPSVVRDRLDGAILETGTYIIKTTDHNISCVGNSFLGEFKDGGIDVNITEPYQIVSCVKITILKRHQNWVLFRHFAIYVNPIHGIK